MPPRGLLEGKAFSPEEIAVMSDAYEIVRKALHDSGQPALVNEIIAERIIALTETQPFDAENLAASALSYFGVAQS